MAVGSQLKALDITWPYKGMNTESPQSEIDPAESPVIENAVITPYEARPRRGIKSKLWLGQYQTPVNGDSVHSMASVNGSLAFGLHDPTVSATFMHSYYFRANPDNAPLPAGFTTTSMSGDVVFSNQAFTPGNTSTTSSLLSPNYFGRTVHFDGMLWGVALLTLSSSIPYVYTWAGSTYMPPGSAVLVNNGAAAVSTGDTTVNLSAPYATSLTNMILGSSLFANDPLQQIYRVQSHTAGTAQLILDRPWGYGRVDATAFPAGAQFILRNTRTAPKLTQGITTIEVYKNRLFGGRAHVSIGNGFPTYYANAIVWSSPGNGSWWPYQNYIILDEEANDPIMGMATCASGMLVFKRNRTGILTGNDESSFQYQWFDGSIGCISETSIHENNGIVYWMSDEGVCAFDGRSIEIISRPSVGRGINSEIMRYRNLPSVSPYRLRSSISSSGDYLFVTEHDIAVGADADHTAWVMDFRTKAWSRFNTASPNSNPLLFHKIDDKLYAVSKVGVYDITDCYSSTDAATALSDVYDTMHDGSSVSVPTTFQVMLKPFGRDTGRMQELELNHNSQYGNATSAPRYAWTIDVATDPSYTSPASSFTVSARYVGNVTQPDYTQYFTDRFTDTGAGLEGSVFRVTFSKVTTLPVLSYRLLNTRLYLSSTTRQGRLDTPIL